MSVAKWLIPRSVIHETEQAFRAGNHEVFAIWTAPLAAPSPDYEITRCVVPQQRPGRTKSGVFVHIEGRELSRIQIDNYQRGERSVIQLHTHPSEDVEMSDLDREWEVVKHHGALSIIVPWYGRLPLLQNANVYERVGERWTLLSKSEVGSRLLFA